MKETGLLSPGSFLPSSSVTHTPRATFNPEILIKMYLAFRGQELRESWERLEEGKETMIYFNFSKNIFNLTFEKRGM